MKSFLTISLLLICLFAASQLTAYTTQQYYDSNDTEHLYINATNNQETIKNDIVNNIDTQMTLFCYTLNAIDKGKINPNSVGAKIGLRAESDVCDIYKRYYRSELFNKGELYIRLKKKFERLYNYYKTEAIPCTMPSCIKNSMY